MAETLSTRLGLRNWGAGTDTPSRTEFNANFTALETYCALDITAVLASRPAAGIVGRYFTATDTGVVYRDTGAAWVGVATNGLDGVFTSSATSTVPLTAKGITSQSANLFEAKVGLSVKASISPAGALSALSYAGDTGALTGTSAGTTVLTVKGAASQSADPFKVVTSASANLFKVTAAGAIASTYLASASGATVLGASTASNISAMSLFAGTPAAEIYSSTGGAGSAFTSMVYLRHDAANTNVVSRRLGFLMQVGDPTVSGDNAKSAAIYLQSAAASFGAPALIVALADAALMTFPTSGAVTLARSLSLTSSANLTVAPGTAQAAIVVSNTAFGVQASDNAYLRTAASGSLYVYAGGSHSDTAAAAGSGGVLLATFVKSAGAGLLTMPRLNLTAGSDALKIGSDASTRIVANSTAIQAYTADITSALTINAGGGNVTIGSSSDTTLTLRSSALGFYSTTAVAKPTVTGSRGSNAALTSLLTALASLGLITNSSS